MTALDVAVIALYLAAVIGVNRYWARRVDVAGWLTSKNSIGLGFLVFTVVSTNVGAGTIVGTAGSTMHQGIGLDLQPQIISLIQAALWGSGLLLPAIIGGLWWPRANSRAALASLCVGFSLNVVLSFVPGLQDTAWMPALGAGTLAFVIGALTTPST